MGPNSSPYGVVFSGGGALGSWEIGCLKVLIENHGEPPLVVTGASAGGLNAAGVCAGFDPPALQELWSSLTPVNVYKSNIKIKTAMAAIGRLSKLGFNLLRRRPLRIELSRLLKNVESIYDTAPLRRTLEEIFGGRAESFFGSSTRFAVSLTDLAKGRKRIAFKAPSTFTGAREDWYPLKTIDDLVGALLGTTALPLIFPQSEGLYDGGVLRNQPIGPAIDFSEDLNQQLVYVIIPSTGSIGAKHKDILELASNLLQVWLSMSLAWQIDLTRQRNNIRMKVYNENKPPSDKNRPPIKLCVIRPEGDLTHQYDVGLLSFGKSVPKLIGAGEQAARARLLKFRPEDETTWY